MQLVWLDRMDPGLLRRVVSTLAALPAGDQQNLATTFCLDMVLSIAEMTELFIFDTTAYGLAWTPELLDMVRSWTSTTTSLFEVTDHVA